MTYASAAPDTLRIDWLEGGSSQAGPANSDLFWWLPGEFVISPVEGVLRVRKDVELDRETIAFYNLTICARDRGVPPLSSTVSPGLALWHPLMHTEHLQTWSLLAQADLEFVILLPQPPQ